MAHSSTIIMFLLLSLHATRTHIVDANANYDYKVEKVSGIDEKEGLIVEKLKAFLLGLRSFQGRNEAGSDGENEFLSSTSSSLSPTPSPCPSPSMEGEVPVPVPSAAPAEAVNVHPLAGHTLPPHPFLGHREESTKRVVAAVAGATILVCVACFICVCWKWKWRRHRRKDGSRDATRPRKVSVNPALDLIYLNSLDMDLELQTSCPKKDFENVKTSPDHMLDEDEEQPKKDQCDGNASNVLSVLDQDSVKHDTTIHVDPQPSHDEDDEEEEDDDDEDSVKHCNGDTAIHVDPPPSYDNEEDDDDDSFHSFCDSHSSHLRLSNASIGSLSDGSEVKSSHLRLSNASIGSLSDKTEISSQKNSPSKSSHCLDVGSSPSAASDNQPIPPPPPPPPPPLTPKPPMPADSNFPPPPCPQPFPKANGKGPPPPPPLSPLGKQGSPLPKLKPLHWDKVRATPDRSMVWDNMRSNSFELDEEMMESLFGYKSMKEDAKSKTPSPGQHILDHKRLQNITILSKALNASSEQICDALIQGQGLCLQQLEALAKMVPTKEEEMKLCSYKGDINELGSAERFVKAVLGVPLAFRRIEAMLYRETFEDEVIHLSNSFSMLQEACKELRSSRLFLKLLEAVLKTGNRMNVGTIRGGAKAFKLDTLLKLADVKGTDGRTTLLHFVVQEIIRSEGVRESESIMGKMSSLAKTADEREEEYTRMGLELVSGLTTELYNVKKTATIDLDVLASSVSNLSDGMAKLNQLVDKELRGRENGGNFVTSMKAFSSVAGEKLAEVQADESNVMVHVRQVTEYFHGELSKSDTNPLRIFVIVRDFLGMLDHVCKELRSYKPPISPNPLASFRQVL